MLSLSSFHIGRRSSVKEAQHNSSYLAVSGTVLSSSSTAPPYLCSISSLWAGLRLAVIILTAVSAPRTILRLCRFWRVHHRHVSPRKIRPMLSPFDHLPIDVQLGVLQYLSAGDIVRLGCCCRELYTLTNSHALWTAKLCADFRWPAVGSLRITSPQWNHRQLGPRPRERYRLLYTCQLKFDNPCFTLGTTAGSTTVTFREYHLGIHTFIQREFAYTLELMYHAPLLPLKLLGIILLPLLLLIAARLALMTHSSASFLIFYARELYHVSRYFMTIEEAHWLCFSVPVCCVCIIFHDVLTRPWHTLIFITLGLLALYQYMP